MLCGDGFGRFWCEVQVFVLLECLNLVNSCHGCYFKKDTLFDLRRITIMTAVYNG